MSTKMYNYRLPKERWWAFAAVCREFYLTHHPLMEVLNQLTAHKDLMSYRQVTKAVDALVAAEWTVDLQIFDEGQTYLIRPLEHGYFFMNNADEWTSYGLERVYYDNRSDVPPEDEKNQAVAEWVDVKIAAHEYLVCPLMHHEDLMSYCFDALMKKATTQ